MRQLLLCFGGAVLLGWLFDWLGVPVGWLLGPMAAGILYVARAGKPQPLNPAYQTVGQVLLGLTTGLSFPLATLKLAAVVHADQCVGPCLLLGPCVQLRVLDGASGE